MIFNASMGMAPYWFLGEVVDNNDPTNAGRVRVRVFGIHPSDPFVADGDKEALDYVEDQDLPWAICVNGTYGKMNMVPDEGDWVFGFFVDGKEAQHPFLLGTLPGTNLDDAGAPPVEGSKRVGSTSNQNRLTNADVNEILSGPQGDQARRNAEEFLGREMSDDEWNNLVAATVAESLPNSPEEQAYAMGVILNRVRSPKYPNSVMGVLHQSNQFQAVTGAAGSGPSNNFINPSQTQIASTISGVNQYLPSAPTTWLNFTSNITSAYGVGTDIGFRDLVANSPGSRVVGGTVFGTVN